MAIFWNMFVNKRSTIKKLIGMAKKKLRKARQNKQLCRAKSFKNIFVQVRKIYSYATRGTEKTLCKTTPTPQSLF